MRRRSFFHCFFIPSPPFIDVPTFSPPALSKRWKSPNPSTSTPRTSSQVASTHGTTTTTTEPQTIRTKSSIQTNLLLTSRTFGTGASSTTAGLSPRLGDCLRREEIDSTGSFLFVSSRARLRNKADFALVFSLQFEVHDPYLGASTPVLPSHGEALPPSISSDLPHRRLREFQFSRPRRVFRT